MFLTWVNMAFSYTLKISEARIQQELAAIMPVKKSKFFITVVLSEPKIELITEGNKIGLHVRTAISIPGRIKALGQLNITGSLSYKAETKEFFFTQSVIEKLEIASIPDKYLVQVKAIIQWLAKKILMKKAVYSLRQEGLKYKFAKSTLKSVSVKGKNLLVVLELF